MRKYLKRTTKRKLSRKKSSKFDLNPIPIENTAPVTRRRIDYDNVVPKSILKDNVNNPEENSNKRVKFNDNVEEFAPMNLNEATYTASLDEGGLHLDDNFPQDGGSSIGILNGKTRETKKPQVNMKRISDDIEWIICELNAEGIIWDEVADLLCDPKISATDKLTVCKKFIEVKGYEMEMQPLIEYYTYKGHVLSDTYIRNSKGKYIYDRSQILKYISGSDDEIVNSILGEFYNGCNRDTFSMKNNILSIISIVDGILQLKNQFEEYYNNDMELIKQVSKYAEILCSMMMIEVKRKGVFSHNVIKDMNKIIAVCKMLMQINNKKP